MSEHLAHAPRPKDEDGTGEGAAKGGLAASFPCTNFRVISIENSARSQLFEAGPEGQRHSAGRVRKAKRDKAEKKAKEEKAYSAIADFDREFVPPSRPERMPASASSSASLMGGAERTPGPPAGGSPYSLQGSAGLPVGRPPTDDERRKVMMKEKNKDELDLKSLLSLTRPLQYQCPGGPGDEAEHFSTDPTLLRSELRKRLSFKRTPVRSLLENEQQNAAAAAAVSKQVDRTSGQGIEGNPRRPPRNGPSSAQYCSDKRKTINATLKLPRSGSAAVTKTSLSDALPSTSWPSISTTTEERGGAGRAYQVSGDVGSGGYLSGPFRRLGVGRDRQTFASGVGDESDPQPTREASLGSEIDPFFEPSSLAGARPPKHARAPGGSATEDPLASSHNSAHRRPSEDRNDLFASSLISSAQDEGTPTAGGRNQTDTGRPVSRQRLPTDALDLFPVDSKGGGLGGEWASVDMFSSPSGGKKKKKGKRAQEVKQQQRQAFLSDGSSHSSSDDIEQQIMDMKTGAGGGSGGDGGDGGATKAGVDFSCLFLDDENEFGGAFPPRKEQTFRVTETDWSRCDGLVPGSGASCGRGNSERPARDGSARNRPDKSTKATGTKHPPSAKQRGNDRDTSKGASEDKGPIYSEDDSDGSGDGFDAERNAAAHPRGGDAAALGGGAGEEEFGTDVLGDFKPSTSRVMVLESVDGDYSSPDEKYFESLYGLLVQTKASPVHPTHTPNSSGSPMKASAPPAALNREDSQQRADRERERSEALAHISRPASVRGHVQNTHTPQHPAHPALMTVSDLPPESTVPPTGPPGDGGPPPSVRERATSGKRRGIVAAVETERTAVPPSAPRVPHGDAATKRLPTC